MELKSERLMCPLLKDLNENKESKLESEETERPKIRQTFRIRTLRISLKSKNILS